MIKQSSIASSKTEQISMKQRKYVKLRESVKNAKPELNLDFRQNRKKRERQGKITGETEYCA